MKLSKTLLFSTIYTISTTVEAHGIVQDLKVGNNWYSGSNPFNEESTNPPRIVWSFFGSGNGPVEDVSSNAIVCNGNAKAASLTAPIKAGESVGLFWTTWPSSHKGPVMTYLAKCPGKCSDLSDPSTLGWFKINEDGYHASDSTWASDKLIANNNSWTVTIPSDVKPGNYLLRHEILALHGASSQGGAQFYPMCANLDISGSGNAEPSTVKFPGAYKATDPGILINIYYPTPTDYTIPGPTVYGSKSTPKATNAVDSSSKSTTFSKTKPTKKSATTLSPEFTEKSSNLAFATTTFTLTSFLSLAAVSPESPDVAYNKCLDRYNACLASHQPTAGGVADFSACTNTCSY